MTYYGEPSGQPEPPIGAGSGGNYTLRGGYGGGLVHVQASGTVTVEGTIRADGADFGNGYSGGGAGGGIWIECNTFAGSNNGLIRANGGGGQTSTCGGGGGYLALKRAAEVSQFGGRPHLFHLRHAALLVLAADLVQPGHGPGQFPLSLD